MIITVETRERLNRVNLDEPLSISIPLKDGPHNPNCYWAEDPKFETIVQDEFVGAVRMGGSVNYKKVSMTPHGNGTHTECLGHITAEEESVNNSLSRFHFMAELITLEPKQVDGDQVLLFNDYVNARVTENVDAVIIRTLPNEISKKQRRYSGTNPPYFDSKILSNMADSGRLHVITDLPSIDREMDEGKLESHHSFWNIPRNKRIESTVTELAFIPDNIEDGVYLLNLQILNLDLDASPSNPVIYKIY